MPVVRELTTRLGYKVDSKDLKKYDKQLGSLGSTLGGLATAALAAGVALAAIGAKAFVTKLVTTNIAFEKMKASLETVTGSAENANTAFAFIQDFASTTPFALSEVSDAFIKLKGLGIEPTEERMLAFGNTASAMGKDLNQLIEAVADASTGEFERLKEFGIKARKQGEIIKFTFQGVTTEVKNDAEEITKFLTEIGTNQFGGAMARQMLTLGGIISNLKDNVDKFLITVGTSGFNDALRRFLAMIRDFAGGGQDFAVTLGKAMGVALDAVTDLTKWVLKNRDAIAKWAGILGMLMNPMLRIFLIVKDLFALLRGEESVIEGLIGPNATKFVRELGKEIWRRIVVTFFALRDVAQEMMPFILESFKELGPSIKELIKLSSELIDEIFAPLGTDRADWLPELIRESLPLLKLLVRGTIAFLKITNRSLAGWVKFATWLVPELRIAWTSFVIFFSGTMSTLNEKWTTFSDAMLWSFDRIKQNWFIFNNFFRTIWDVTTGFLRGNWDVLNLDVTGAIDKWTTALKAFLALLQSVGIDMSGVTSVVDSARSAVGLGGEGNAQVAPAGAGGSGGFTRTSADALKSVTSSIGSLIVQITGTTAMGPDQITSATQAGVSIGIKDALADASRNSAGAVT